MGTGAATSTPPRHPPGGQLPRHRGHHRRGRHHPLRPLRRPSPSCSCPLSLPRVGRQQWQLSPTFFAQGGGVETPTISRRTSYTLFVKLTTGERANGAKKKTR